MEEAYLLILLALIWLAVTDLVVGVSNDAINFLHSAVGSKAIALKKILIVASIGIACGTVFSSGLMEVARNGIFLPGEFYFEEIMVIFLAVMVTDVILLDFYNSLGLPTSTTVAIVFELLGAAVAIAAIKVYQDSGNFNEVLEYINTSKTTEIMLGLLVAVVLAFVVGALVQYISRIIFTFHFEKNLKYFGSIFGGVSLAAILFFILLKGVESIAFLPDNFVQRVDQNTWSILVVSLLFFIFISHLLMKFFKVDILKVVIIVGTFALALSFAGNDLVNFIGVPIAAWQAFDMWREANLLTGVLPTQYLMTAMEEEVTTPTYLLVIAGGVMILTLWFSKRAKSVVETGVNLSRHGYGEERFSANFLSRTIVRHAVFVGEVFHNLLPEKFEKTIGSRFKKPRDNAKGFAGAPAFDKVRASVNLVVASILISIGTNLQLPLSTTYVTFMVAMGTSFADGAWDRENAVYRVSGVLSVIGGWFVTGFIGFAVAAIFALIIFYGGLVGIALLMGIAVFVLSRSAVLYARKTKEEKALKSFQPVDLGGIQEIVAETSDTIAQVIARINKMYSLTIDNLGYYDQKKLKKARKSTKKLEEDIDELKGNVFYFIRSIRDDSLESPKFYVLCLDYLQDMVQKINYITRNSYKHVNNNHKNLKFSHIKDLKKIEGSLKELFSEVEDIFRTHDFSKIEAVLRDEELLRKQVSDLLQKQIERIRTSQTSPKNAMLYFSLLLETRDLVKSCGDLLKLFRDFDNQSNNLPG